MIVHPTWAWIEAQNAKRARRHLPLPLRPRAAHSGGLVWRARRAARRAPSTPAKSSYVFDNLAAFPWLIDDADRELAEARLQLLD